MSLRLSFVLAMALFLGLRSEAPAAYDVRGILDARRHLYETTYAWSDQHQVVRVTIVDAHDRRQERMIELYERRYADGARKALLVFLAPDNLKGTAVLSQERASGVNEGTSGADERDDSVQRLPTPAW